MSCVRLGGGGGGRGGGGGGGVGHGSRGEGVIGREVSTGSCFSSDSLIIDMLLLSPGSTTVRTDSVRSGRFLTFFVLVGFDTGTGMDFLALTFFGVSVSDSCSSELLLALTTG